MTLIPTEEHEALRDVMQAFLGKHSSESALRVQLDTELGYDESAWKTAADQIGLSSLVIPEEFGGAGYGFDELAIVMEETGRTLYTGPVLSTIVLATSALLCSHDIDACERYLPAIAAGELIATVAVSERASHWDPEDITVTARAGDDGWVLDGCKPYVLDGARAGLIIVAARTDAGISLFCVDTASADLRIEPRDVLDLSRRFASVTFTAASAVLLGQDGGGWPVLMQVFDRAIVALACEQVGGSRAVLDATVEYLKVRHQFGRPIGSFQALKHRCADMLVELESARSAAAYASTAVANGSDDASVAASIAKTYCSKTFYHIAAESIQMHGGIGFTWEHPAHLYFKRAKSAEVLFGPPAWHRERLAELLGLVSSGV